MSENTNTLFWVITGALVVLAVFLLISTSQDESLNAISGKFNVAWDETINPPEPVDPRYITTSENEVFLKNGETSANLNGIDIILDGYRVNVGAYKDIIHFHYVNNTGQTINNKKIRFLIYNYETGDFYHSYYWPLNNFENGAILNQYGGLIDNPPAEIYAKIVLE